MSTAMKLKTCQDIEKATSMFIGILQHTAKADTPKQNPSSPVSNLPSDIKRLVATKRRARSTWQKTHAPEDRRLFNNTSNKLKTALRNLRNTSFTAYVSSLKRDETTQISEKTTNTPPPDLQKFYTPGTLGQERL